MFVLAIVEKRKPTYILYLYYEKRADMVYREAKTRDIGRLAYGDIGRKNPGLYKLINKAVYMEPVL